jgi:hypothetical protein
MPLIQTGNHGGPDDRDRCPTPAGFSRSKAWKCLAECAEQKNAQQSVAEDMSAFADEVVPGFEVCVVEAEQKVQERKQYAAGMRGRTQTRLEGDDDQPQDRGDPCLENLVTIGAQVGWQSMFPPFAKNAKDGAPSLVRCPPCRQKRDKGEATALIVVRALFDRIIRRLTGDHDIVDMTFAQAGPADADEARFLQKFGDRCAPTIAHT